MKDSQKIFVWYKEKGVKCFCKRPEYLSVSQFFQFLCKFNLFIFKGDNLEPFTALGMSCDGKFLTTGTEQINEEDVFIYVW